MKKHTCALAALLSLSVLPVGAEQQNTSMTIIADGHGTLLIQQGDQEMEMVMEGEAVVQKIDTASSLTIRAIPYEEYEVSFFSCQNEDGTGELIAMQSVDTVEQTFTMEQSKLVQISFGTSEESQSFYHQNTASASKIRRAPKASSYESLLQHNIGDTFTGRLTTNNADIYAEEFHVDYIDGGLGPFADLFTSGEVILHCLNPGYIAPTAVISVYGMYAPIYHTYHATITNMDKTAGKVTVSMYTDPIQTPYGTPLYGYNNGMQVGYQTLGRTKEYGGEIEFTAPGTNVTIHKLNSEGLDISGAILQVLQGNRIVNTFTTGREPYIFRIQNGEYTIKEIQAPAGFVLASPVTVTVNNENTVFKITDMRVSVLKTDKETGKPVENALLQVKDEEGNVVDSFRTTKEKYYLSNLVENRTYTLEEAEVPAGYAKAAPVTFTPVQGKDISITMEDVPVTFEKKDSIGKCIKGAQFEIRNTNGDVIESFTSGTSAFLPLHIEYGQTYTIYEIGTPEGYVTMEPVTFTIDKESSYHFSFVDYQVKISKKDLETKDMLQGASLEVTDKDGKVADSWISTDMYHAVSGLKKNQTYTLKEVSPPSGYAKAKPIQFTTSENKDIYLTMEDVPVTFEKKDVSGNYIPGATFEIRNENEKVVESFTTDTAAYYPSHLEAGETYTIYETGTPEGYVTMNPVSFTVDSKNSYHFIFTDYQVKVSKKDIETKAMLQGATLEVIDKSGKVVDSWISTNIPHAVSGLKMNASYTLREVKTPASYTRAEDISFTTTEENRGIDMYDTQVSVYKTDESGNAVEGAHLIVKDTDGKIMDEWDTTSERHSIRNLEAGKTYALQETISPDGFYFSKDITFTVEGKENQMITMKDAQTRFSFLKVDEENHPVEGVQLMLFDETDRKTVEEWTSDKNAHVLQNVLIASHWYRLIETEIVNGVYQSVDVVFQCPKYHDGTPVTVTMVDELASITALKTDEAGNPLAGASLCIVEAVKQTDGTYTLHKNEKGELVKEYSFVTSNSLKGEDISQYVRTDKKYYLVETKAPEGYEVAEPVLFEIHGTTGHTQVIRMMDEKEPQTVQTGVHTNMKKYAYPALISMVLGAFVCLKRRKM